MRLQRVKEPGLEIPEAMTKVLSSNKIHTYLHQRTLKEILQVSKPALRSKNSVSGERKFLQHLQCHTRMHYRIIYVDPPIRMEHQGITRCKEPRNNISVQDRMTNGVEGPESNGKDTTFPFSVIYKPRPALEIGTTDRDGCATGEGNICISPGRINRWSGYPPGFQHVNGAEN